MDNNGSNSSVAVLNTDTVKASLQVSCLFLHKKYRNVHDIVTYSLGSQSMNRRQTGNR